MGRAKNRGLFYFFFLKFENIEGKLYCSIMVCKRGAKFKRKLRNEYTKKKKSIVTGCVNL